jgi:hypothetical protein
MGRRYGYFLNDIPGPEVWIDVTRPGFPGNTVSVRALIDTGSCQTVLPVSVRAKLKAFGWNPPRSFRQDVSTIQGKQGKPTSYPEISIDLYIDGFLMADSCPVLLYEAEDMDFALIGRDLLNRYTLTLKGPVSGIDSATWEISPL